MGHRSWPDGREYEGQFVAGSPHGKGALIVNGFRFEGAFKQGRPVGPIVLVSPDGARQRGRMVNSRFVAQ